MKVIMAVNGADVPLKAFLVDFYSNTLSGMVASLKGAEEIEKLEVVLEGKKVKLTLNGKPISMNPFTNAIFASTLSGMVMYLKGMKRLKDMKSLSFKLEK